MINKVPTYQVNDRLVDFVVTNAVFLEELQLTLYELEHEPTGAFVIYLANDDPENLFCLSFRTLPTDSTGVAHILEHTVLCGSKKFPVKDPFFSMNRRSLNTFMNAMTGADTTFYPASSQVETDFYNLLDIYLDAVFFPKLKKLSFLQEGHRLEFEIPGDLRSPLIFKGIVFNEMKGNMSQPESRLWEAFLSTLMPDLTYAFNSGGDPKEIPALTYEELLAFHKTYYHPSRCLFFFYGNLPLKKHLDFINQRVLSGAKKEAPLPLIPLQRRFTKQTKKTAYYPIEGDDKEGKTFLTYGWLTVHVSDQDEVLALAALDLLLMETDASPLKKALLESKLCTQANSYLDADMSEIPYAIVCRGCEQESEQKLQAVLFKVLGEVEQKGFSQSAIEAVIHQLTFSRLEIARDHGPFGLTLFGRAGFSKQHNCSVEHALSVNTSLAKLKEKARDPRYFSQLIKTYLINNPHFVALTLAPDKLMAEKETLKERKVLDELKLQLSPDQEEALLTQAEELKEYQQETEHQSIDCLPIIALSEIPSDPPNFPLSEEKSDKLTTFYHESFTNKILYADLIFDLPQIDWDDLPYLQLFVSLLPELGAGGRNYQENLDYISAYLGDFTIALHLHPQASDGNKLLPTLSLRGKALAPSSDKLFALFLDVCSKVATDDRERISQLIKQLATAQQNSLNRHALSYAVNLSLSGLSLCGALWEKWGGLSYFTFIRDLSSSLTKRLDEVIEKFDKIKQKVFHGHHPKLLLSCDQAIYETVRKEGFYGLTTELKSSPFKPWESPTCALSSPPSQGRPISSPVAFSSLSFKVSSGFNSSSASLLLATYLLDNTFLHTQIREQGGAYGAGAHYNPTTGHFYFYSYRDPRIAATYQVFHKSLEMIIDKKFTDQDLIEAKLSFIQDSDTPISPGNRTWVSYCRQREEKTLSLRKKFRSSLLNVTGEDLKRAIEDEFSHQDEKGIGVSFADRSLLEAELANWPILPI